MEMWPTMVVLLLILLANCYNGFPIRRVPGSMLENGGSGSLTGSSGSGSSGIGGSSGGGPLEANNLGDLIKDGLHKPGSSPFDLGESIGTSSSSPGGIGDSVGTGGLGGSNTGNLGASSTRNSSDSAPLGSNSVADPLGSSAGLENPVEPMVSVEPAVVISVLPVTPEAPVALVVPASVGLEDGVAPVVSMDPIEVVSVSVTPDSSIVIGDSSFGALGRSTGTGGLRESSSGSLSDSSGPSGSSGPGGSSGGSPLEANKLGDLILKVGLRKPGSLPYDFGVPTGSSPGETGESVGTGGLSGYSTGNLGASGTSDSSGGAPLGFNSIADILIKDGLRKHGSSTGLGDPIEPVVPVKPTVVISVLPVTPVVPVPPVVLASVGLEDGVAPVVSLDPAEVVSVSVAPATSIGTGDSNFGALGRSTGTGGLSGYSSGSGSSGPGASSGPGGSSGGGPLGANNLGDLIIKDVLHKPGSLPYHLGISTGTDGLGRSSSTTALGVSSGLGD